MTRYRQPLILFTFILFALGFTLLFKPSTALACNPGEGRSCTAESCANGDACATGHEYCVWDEVQNYWSDCVREVDNCNTQCGDSRYTDPACAGKSEGDQCGETTYSDNYCCNEPSGVCNDEKKKYCYTNTSGDFLCGGESIYQSGIPHKPCSYVPDTPGGCGKCVLPTSPPAPPPTPTPTPVPTNYCADAGYTACTPGAVVGTCTLNGQTCTQYAVYSCNFEGINYCGTPRCAAPCGGGVLPTSTPTPTPTPTQPPSTQPTPTPNPVTLSGRVTNSVTGTGMSGVVINQGQNCIIGNPTTNWDGYFSYTVPYGQGFCMRGPSIPGYTQSSGNYECQSAGSYKDPDICGLHYDVGPDNQYNFTYTPNPVTLSGRVTNSVTGTGMSGVVINRGQNCYIGTATTDANGDFNFSSYYGQGFCMRGPSIPGYTQSSGNYECQSAGSYKDPDICGLHYDVGPDNRYNFSFTPDRVVLSGKLTDSTTGTGIPGRIINENQDCRNDIGVAATMDDGTFSFMTNANFNIYYGLGFCLRGPSIPSYTQLSGNYECQTAGYLQNPDTCGLRNDIAPDNRYNFSYAPNNPCPGGTSNCGNRSGGGLGSCSGTWTPTGNADNDNWCSIWTRGARPSCYACTAPATPTPRPWMETSGDIHLNQ